MSVRGLAGKPVVDLADYVDVSGAGALDEEITYALATIETTYTGGYHHTTGRALPGQGPPEQDWGHAIAKLTERERERYLSLLPHRPEGVEADELVRREPTPAQKRYLKIAHRVYFPWQVYLQIYPATREHPPALPGQRMAPHIKNALGQTLAYVDRLPMARVDRIDLLGVDPHQYPIIHRDPWDDVSPALEFIHITPRGDRRVFVYDADEDEKHYLPPVAATFNNYDYHGADPLPHFSYSLRVEGRFDDALRSALGL